MVSSRNKAFFCTPVSTSLFNTDFDISSAIFKDLFTVGMTSVFLKERTKRTIKDEDKAARKYAVFVIAFLCEDFGQVLCQETLTRYRRGSHDSTQNFLYYIKLLLMPQKFIYYEQFKTKVGAFSVANAMLMACISVTTLKLFIFTDLVRNHSKSKF